MEDGEKLHDLDVGLGLPGQPQAVFQYPRPMADAVGAMPGQGIVFEDSMNKGFEIEHPATTVRGMGFRCLLKFKRPGRE